MRGEAVKNLREKQRAAKDEAWARAKRYGVRTKWQHKGISYELMRFDGDRLVYYHTYNKDAAISAGVNLVYVTPYNLNGAGVTVGVWDYGQIKATHQEFGSRVTVVESATPGAHMTHVAGTIGAAGVQSQAKGMAPQASLLSYDWAGDVADMLSVGASYAGQTNHIYISNHSYGVTAGWEWSDGSAYWYGTGTARKDAVFGQYGQEAASWDGVCCNVPYFLPIRAAGNDRDDPAPANGATFYRWEWLGGLSYGWVAYLYNSATDPYADGYWLGGYDTVPDGPTAKNVLTVGAVYDAVAGGVRSLAPADVNTMFSAWGPTDDGRIKPDVVGNGWELYSPGWDPNLPGSGSNTSYWTMTGTSMAAPNVCGAAALLIQQYGQFFPGQAMRSSTLKALIIHTASDLGNPGPDYTYGWGLVNAKAAADLIIEHHTEPRANTIHEGVLAGPQSVDSYTFERNGSSSVRVTLCWTDPAAGSTSALDDHYPRLLHDLDVRVLDSNGVIGQPYVLDQTHPNWPATRGDNYLDNVEQVDVSPGSLHDKFTVRVSMKNNSSGGRQVYSLIVTGQEIEPHPVLIRGKVSDSTTGLGVAGVAIHGEPGELVATTDSQGDYELMVPYGWELSPARGTVTPVKYAYEFAPATRDYNDVTMDYQAQNYTATAMTRIISGWIGDSNGTSISAVQLASNPNIGMTYSDANGVYSLTVPYGYSGAISPSKDAIAFMPASIDYNDVIIDYSGQDYVASGVFYRISGRVVDASGAGLAGARIVADANNGAIYTDSGGNYYFDVPRHYHGTLAPVKDGYVLQPLSRYYPDLMGPISGQDYAVETKLYDGFADNRKSAAWFVHNGQPGALDIREQGYRLNVIAADPNNTEVLYRGNGWHVDPNVPFTMKIDYHLGITGVGEPNDGWVTFGFDNAAGGRVVLSAGCAGGQRYFAFKAIVDGNSYSAQQPRTTNDGTLYITYDPNGEKLYLSHTEYGVTNAWQTLLNALGGSNGPHVTVFAGGGGKGVNLAYGQAWLDNLEINKGVFTEWPPATDLDKDGFIGWGDIWVLAEHWLQTYPTYDINKDGRVNFKDFALIATTW